MKLQFTKMHGAGNDFIVIDSTEAPFTMTTNQLRFIADRHLGIGADQILIVEKARTPHKISVVLQPPDSFFLQHHNQCKGKQHYADHNLQRIDRTGKLHIPI